MWPQISTPFPRVGVQLNPCACIYLKTTRTLPHACSLGRKTIESPTQPDNHSLVTVSKACQVTWHFHPRASEHLRAHVRPPVADMLLTLGSAFSRSPLSTVGQRGPRGNQKTLWKKVKCIDFAFQVSIEPNILNSVLSLFVSETNIINPEPSLFVSERNYSFRTSDLLEK